MGKTLSERIALKAGAAAGISQKGSKHLAAILAIKVEIFEALDDGWNKKTIWMQLRAENKFSASYLTFLRVWNKLVQKDSNQLQRVEPPTEIKHLPRVVSVQEDSFSFDKFKK